MAERQVANFLEADRLAFFQALQEGFRRAADSAGVVERRYRIAGHVVGLRFAGPALIEAIDPALAHLALPEDKPASLTIELFDSVSTGSRLPLLVESLTRYLCGHWWEQLDKRGEITAYHGQRIKSAFHAGPNILSVLDVVSSLGIYWINDARDVPYYEKGYPLATLLSWWFGHQDLHYIHAAAFGLEQGGVLLTGKGGSGKSTTTQTCLVNSGFRIVGDDYCIADMETNVAHSVYNTIKLKGLDDVERFPSLKPGIENLEQVLRDEEREKAVFHIHRHFPGRMCHSLPIRAILIPHITGRPGTHFQPTSAAEAFRALAPSTIFQLSNNAQTTFQALATMVRRIPAYGVGLGSDIAAIPEAIQRFLDGLEVDGAGST